MLVSTIITNGQLLADVPNTTFFTAAEALEAVQTSWKDIYAMLAESGDEYFTTPLYFNFSNLVADQNRQNAYFYNLPSDFYRLILLQYQGSFGGNQFYPVTRMNRSNFGNTQNTPSYRIVGQRVGVQAGGSGGSGLTVNTTVTGTTVTGVAVNAGGTGYSIGDIINISSSNITAPAICTVTTIGGSGAVTGLSIYYGGSNYTAATGSATTNQLNGAQLSIYTQVQYPNWCLWYIPAPVTLTTTTDLTYPYSMIPEIMSYQVAIEIRRKQNVDYKDKQERRNELIKTMKSQINRDENRAETPKNVFNEGFGAYV